MKKKPRLTSTDQNVQTKKLNVLTAYLEKDPEGVLAHTQTLMNKHPSDIELLVIAGSAARMVRHEELALSYVDSALSKDASNLSALRVRAQIEIDKGNNAGAAPFLIQAVTAHPGDAKAFVLLFHALLKLKRFDEFFSYFESLSEKLKNSSSVLNNYGQALLEVARVEEALAAFGKSIKKDPSCYVPSANRIVALHYSPNYTPEDILKECRSFQERLLPSDPIRRAQAKSLIPNKKIRIGMISGGFCSHPVGSMITHGLLHVKREQIEFYAYSTNRKHDHITEKIKNICAKWDFVDKISDKDLDALIRQDEIDILFDLSGFNDNSRMTTVMMEPAPIIIKWVGGLISSTGVDAIDYLLSDRIETPLNADTLYTEKLIRLPDDYICFEPPLYTPPVNGLPAKQNGYVTFGCFNNASKINDELLEKWAEILNQLPDSRLFLKSHAFSSTDLRDRVNNFFTQHGIKQDRIRLEGASPHRQLLACYNEVDIALDPWPYSGGLTTCEALIMGVPVITMPGPTFAGRHSATHLFNAGMPELIADNWERYIQLATSLATDVDSLDTIRQNLRFIVLQSPLCDAARFSQSFTNAMRAIWQRHCAGKVPEGLVLGDDLVPYFSDEPGPVELSHAKSAGGERDKGAEEGNQNDGFRFELNGRVIMVDNGTNFIENNGFLRLKSLSAFQFIIFDPAGAIEKRSLPIDADSSIQYFPYHGLGDGEQITLYATLDPRCSSTLAPVGYSSGNKNRNLIATSVVAEAPIFSVKSDSIAGLSHIDWLLLSGRHDVMPILNQNNALAAQALVVQVNLPARHQYQGQPGIDTLVRHMEGIGFDLYRIDGAAHHDYLSDAGIDKQALVATHITEYALLFVPNQGRLEQLSEHERERFTFILHTAYGVEDFVSHVLGIGSSTRAKQYLDNLGVKESTRAPNHQATIHVPGVSSVKPAAYEIPTAPAMSKAEISLLKSYLGKCRNYFEFGTGGSSKLAASMGLAVNGVESDQQWLEQLQCDIGPQNLKYCDIGPTREWGYPADHSAQNRFPLYSAAIHDSQHGYDFILVDGRFRVACALQSAKHIMKHGMQKNAVIFIHDFWGRDYYHPVLNFLDEIESVDTAAVFRVKENFVMKDIEAIIKEFEKDFR